MRIIPVLDVLNGVVVHAVRGVREQYQPLESVLSSSSDPVAVASVFKSLGFDLLYLADLDAILNAQLNCKLYKEIQDQVNIDLMVDAGISDVEKAQKVLQSGVSTNVIGTETLRDLVFLEESIKSFGGRQVAVSLDMKGEKVISVSQNVSCMKPLDLAHRLEEIGVGTVILLDLNRVGTECGVNRSLVESFLDKTKLEVLVGGGIRDIKDIKELRDMGVSGVLVATALHVGKLDIRELKSTGFI